MLLSQASFITRKARWPNVLVHSVTRLSSPGSRPGQSHCVVFLGKTLHSHGASLHPGV